MKHKAFHLLLFLILASCSQPHSESAAQAMIEQVEPANSAATLQNEFGFYEAMEQGPDLFGEDEPRARMQTVNVTDASSSAQDTVSQPISESFDQQIAYSYGFGFQIDSDKISELQSAHLSLCESLGRDCRVLRTSQATSDSWDGYGEIQLEVAANKAGNFEEGLSQLAEELGGKLVSSVRDGEDLSDSIIDAEARLKSRLILRQKLTNILERNQGSTAELIAAEKAVADVNEQIDSTRSKLNSYKARIRFSNVRIEYEPYFGQSQLGFGKPIMTALRSIGTTLGTSIAALIYVMTALIPFILLIAAIRWVLHRFGLRLRFWRKDSTSVESNG